MSFDDLMGTSMFLVAAVVACPLVIAYPLATDHNPLAVTYPLVVTYPLAVGRIPLVVAFPYQVTRLVDHILDPSLVAIRIP